ncbi:MAG: vWA domain-containing protein [Parcubacteria group bacterium]
MKKIILQLSLVFFISTLIVFFAGNFASSQSSSDAIAIRVMPNPNHYTIERWYQEQGFEGSPQSLIVDGYQAIRDGRTVYVNAANVNTATNQIYTNIYLISYTQESEDATVDILGQIISHWKFNHNIINTGKCSISTMYCEEDDDCPGNYVCGNGANDWQEGKCVIEDDTSDLSNTKTCLTDQDCPNNLYCTSLKSRVIRDVRRLGQLTDASYLLDLYNSQNNKYPTLNSGTYIPQMTISTWPSWQNELSKEIQLSSNMVDPVNTFGYCDGDFAPETCWNSDEQKFYDPNLQDGVDLPDNTLVYVYTTDVNGTDYDLCANMESDYDVAEGSVSNFDCNFDIGYFGTIGNETPILVDFNLEGSSSETFSGMIRVEDPEGNPMTWELDTSLSSWSSWSSPPELQNTNNPNQKRVFAQITGNNGTYPIKIIVTDNAGNVMEETVEIVVSNTGPQIQAEDINYVIDEDNPLDYKAYIYSNNLPDSVSSFNSNLTVSYSGFPSGFNSGTYSTGQTSLGHGLSKEIEKIADNRFELNISGLLGDTNGDGSINENLGLDDPEPEKINFTLTVQDKDGRTSTEDFTFNIIFDKPILALDCLERIRAGSEYSCQVVVYSTENTSLYYSNLPSGLKGDQSGLISGTAIPSGIHNISVTATNEYGGSTTSGYSLDINSYCGDGVQQELNDEGTGGPDGDGREECDVDDNVATSPALSGPDKQYDCTTDTIAQHDQPVPMGTCTFDGGYCGDGVLQKNVNGRNLESCDYGDDIPECCVTCAWAYDYEQTNLSFINGEPEANLDKDDVAYVDFPEVIDFDLTSGVMDAEVIATGLGTTAIVYVTDTSGSMQNSGVENVKEGLIGINGDEGALGLLRENSGNIAVGLVEFNSDTSMIQLDNIHSDAHYNTLVDTIGSYSAGGSTYTKDAVNSAAEMLNSYDAENKFIVLLSDGAPNPSNTQDPTEAANNAKAAGVSMYTITYRNDSIVDAMCKWSSDSQSVCDAGSGYVYSYQSSNVDTVYIKITDEIITGPEGTLVVTINGKPYSFDIGDNVEDGIMTDLHVNYEAIACDPYTAVCTPDEVPIEVDFDGEGEIRLYNLRLDVAEPCAN